MAFYAAKTYFLTGFYHLLYMLAVIYTLALVYLASRLPHGLGALYAASFPLLLAGILMFGYGNAFLDLPAAEATLGRLDSDVSMETQWLFSIVPFFMMGYALNNGRIDRRLNNRAHILLIASCSLYLAEILLGKIAGTMASTTLCFTTYPMVLSLLLLAFEHPQIGSGKMSLYASGMASFVYFSHILFVLIFQRAGLPETCVFLLTMTITAILAYLVVRYKNPITKRLI